MSTLLNDRHPIELPALFRLEVIDNVPHLHVDRAGEVEFRNIEITSGVNKADAVIVEVLLMGTGVDGRRVAQTAMETGKPAASPRHEYNAGAAAPDRWIGKGDVPTCHEDVMRMG